MFNKQNFKYLFVLFCVCTARQATGAVEPVHVRTIASELQKYVKPFSRPVHTYSFDSRENVGVPITGWLDLMDPKITSYIPSTTAKFWDLSQVIKPANAFGLYVATDPVISRQYGGDNWLLFRIIVPKNFRFLDLRKPEDGSFLKVIPHNVKAAMVASGCHANRYKDFFLGRVSLECRQTAFAVIRALRADGIMYDFIARNFEGCTGRSDGAMLIVDSSKITASNVAVFYENSPGHIDERTLYNDLYRQALPPSGDADPEQQKVPPVLWPHLPVADGDHTIWMKQNFFSCGQYPEDQLGPLK